MNRGEDLLGGGQEKGYPIRASGPPVLDPIRASVAASAGA